MTTSSSENRCEDYSSDVAHTFLDEKGHLPGALFKEKIRKAESILRTKLKSFEVEIFCNNTVYSGSAGVALVYFLYGLKRPNNQTDYFTEAFKYLNLKKLEKRRVTFLCGDAGPLSIAAAISYKLGMMKPKNMPDFHDCIKDIIALQTIAEKTGTPDEVLYGRAGYLYALLFTRKHTKYDAIPSELISRIANAIIRSGQKFAIEKEASVPLMWEWHNKIYLGAAHGAAGILYMLLLAQAFIAKDDIEKLIVPTLDGLLDVRHESGNLPSSLGSSGGDRLVQWCHGAPGLVQLCCIAYDLRKDVKYLNAAMKCGEVVWARGLTIKGYSICHGVAGNAYTFLQLYQLTKDPKHLYRACCFTNWCIDRKPGTEFHRPDRPASLFEGMAGQLLLLQDIRDPLNAAFPAYDL